MERAPMSQFEAMLWQVACWAPYGGRVISRHEDPYLLRVYLTPRAFPDDNGVRPFLHYFVRGDRDSNPHSHPWWAGSLILTGGYAEQRLVGAQLLSRIFKPGNLNFLARSTFHRADLLQPDIGCWTLIFTGPHVGETGDEWGFFDMDERRYVPWEQYSEPA
jgi:hypothetical protein